MADLLRHLRISPGGRTFQLPRVSVNSFRELYHENSRHIFNSHDIQVHDCRHEITKNYKDESDFETWLLSYGLSETNNAVKSLHSKIHKQAEGVEKSSNKLLYKVGQRGCSEVEFQYPRGICITKKGDILVADTKNHRIQQFTSFGVFVRQFGKLGQSEREFNEPCAVLELTSGQILVADSKNARVQVLNSESDFQFHLSLPLSAKPYALSCRDDKQLVVATTDKRIFVFDVFDRDLKTIFNVGSALPKPGFCPVFVCMDFDLTILVSVPEDGYIYRYSLDGRQLARFQPTTPLAGLSMTVGSICVTSASHILVSDTLNHTVNLYTGSGKFHKQVLSPIDDVESIQSLALGQEGHLVLTDLSIGSEHCLKIFRFQNCACHEGTSPAMKRA